jgi:hypothetical protein
MSAIRRGWPPCQPPCVGKSKRADTGVCPYGDQCGRVIMIVWEYQTAVISTATVMYGLAPVPTHIHYPKWADTRVCPYGDQCDRVIMIVWEYQTAVISTATTIL